VNRQISLIKGEYTFIQWEKNREIAEKKLREKIEEKFLKLEEK